MSKHQTTYGKPRVKLEAEPPEVIPIRNTTLNTPSNTGNKRDVDVEHLSVVYPDGSYESRIRSAPDKTMTIGETEPQKIDPIIRHWQDMANRGEKTPTVSFNNNVLNKPHVEAVDVTISEIEVTDKQPTMDAAGWRFASKPDDKKVVRLG